MSRTHLSIFISMCKPSLCSLSSSQTQSIDVQNKFHSQLTIFHSLCLSLPLSISILLYLINISPTSCLYLYITVSLHLTIPLYLTLSFCHISLPPLLFSSPLSLSLYLTPSLSPPLLFSSPCLSLSLHPFKQSAARTPRTTIHPRSFRHNLRSGHFYKKSKIHGHSRGRRGRPYHGKYPCRIGRVTLRLDSFTSLRRGSLLLMIWLSSMKGFMASKVNVCFLRRRHIESFTHNWNLASICVLSFPLQGTRWLELTNLYYHY